MKKSLQVLSAILVASFALANVVSAEIKVAGEKQDTTFEKLLESVEHKTVNTKAYYESLIDAEVESKALNELTDAMNAFEKDVTKVSQYSQELCKAKKELIEADKDIKKAALYTQLADKLVKVTVTDGTTKAGVAVPQTVQYIFKADLDELNSMDKNWKNENQELKEIAASTDILGNPIPGKTVDEQKVKINEAAKKLVAKIVAYHVEAEKAWNYEAKTYEATVAELRTKAALASAKVKLIKEFGKRMNVTFVPCEFEDPFETAAEAKQAETKKAEEKKDSVPNTAAFNFFPQLPTTCSYAIVSEGEGCCKVFKVVKACDLKKGEKTVAMTYAQLAEYSIPALACSCK